MLTLYALKQKTVFEWFFAVTCILSLIAGFSIYHIPDIMLSLMQISITVYIFLRRVGRNKIVSLKNFRHGVLFCIFLSLIFISSIFKGSFPSTSLFIYAYFGGAFIMLDNKTRFNIFSIFLRLYTILLLLSLFEYVFIIAGMGIKIAEMTRDASLIYTYDHYLLNVLESDMFITRFQSIFHEPGDIGTLNGLLIFGLINKKDFIFEYWVLVISGLFSLSLAFYILFIIHLAFNLKTVNKGFVILFLLLSYGSYYVLKESIDVLIVDRFLEDRYDNRNTDVMQEAYQNAYKNNELFWGKGAGAHTLKGGGASAGAKVFIYEFGFWGLLLLIIAFYIVYFGEIKKKNLYNILYFLVFWLSFYQRQNVYEVQIIMALLTPVIFDNNPLGTKENEKFLVYKLKLFQLVVLYILANNPQKSSSFGHKYGKIWHKFLQSLSNRRILS